MKQDILNKNEGVFVDLIYHIAEKVVMEHVQKSETTTKEVIKQVIDSLDVKEDISVRLNEEDFKIMQHLMGEKSQDAEIFKKLKFYADPEIQRVVVCLKQTTDWWMPLLKRELQSFGLF